MTTDRTQSPHIDQFRDLFAVATHDASAAMCRWTRGRVHLFIDEARELPSADVAGELELDDELLATVLLRLEGLLGGEIVLLFDADNGRRLAGVLTQHPIEPHGAWSDLERSALCETCNILGCAYVNALTRLLGVELFPSPPEFVEDRATRVLEQALAEHAACGERVLVYRMGFRREGDELSWYVLFVPGRKLRERIEDALAAAS